MDDKRQRKKEKSIIVKTRNGLQVIFQESINDILIISGKKIRNNVVLD